MSTKTAERFMRHHYGASGYVGPVERGKQIEGELIKAVSDDIVRHVRLNESKKFDDLRFEVECRIHNLLKDLKLEDIVSDVRKLSDEELFDAVELCYSQLDPRKTAVAECPKASHEEAIAELGRRLGIMRELCEAAEAYRDDQGAAIETVARLQKARDAFRQMEAERESK